MPNRPFLAVTYGFVALCVLAVQIAAGLPVSP